jgi:hypothetical protein
MVAVHVVSEQQMPDDLSRQGARLRLGDPVAARILADAEPDGPDRADGCMIVRSWTFLPVHLSSGQRGRWGT